METQPVTGLLESFFNLVGNYNFKPLRFNIEAVFYLNEFHIFTKNKSI